MHMCESYEAFTSFENRIHHPSLLRITKILHMEEISIARALLSHAQVCPLRVCLLWLFRTLVVLHFFVTYECDRRLLLVLLSLVCDVELRAAISTGTILMTMFDVPTPRLDVGTTRLVEMCETFLRSLR